MKAKTNFWKKSLALVMMLAVVLSSMPALAFADTTDSSGNTAVPQAGTDFISMPITIRDYAADGMLFEFNQLGRGLATYNTTNGNVDGGVFINPTEWDTNGYKGLRVLTYEEAGTALPSLTLHWHCLICDPQGNVVRVIAGGESKVNTYAAAMKEGYYSVWAWKDSTNSNAHGAIGGITESNKAEYRVFYTVGDTVAANKIQILRPETINGVKYHHGDNAGFSLLSTGIADRINNLLGNTGIDNTKLVQNGTWGLEQDPTPIGATLNNGAKQSIYGAWVRTGLVDTKLVNGKIQYTEAAVSYLAAFMQEIMKVEWQNTDGSRNLYHVMGAKIFDDNGNLVGKARGTRDLASLVREKLNANGWKLGTFSGSKSKYDNNLLTSYKDIVTCFDAAYFLLHNMFDDSAAYGMKIDNYKTLKLVQKTDNTGTYYVFNSGYDNTAYDYTNGVIYNTQVDTITGAPLNGNESSGKFQYIRGNLLPKSRFDPLGLSGAGADLGYGMSGDTYGAAIGGSGAAWSEYYDNTNYNLTLEGHAEFIYYEEDNLYFTFTGDDDVYLFINDELVLDLGAAHSISKVRVDINDVAELCGLENGKPYKFDFYYAERHGTAANFGIETNIKIVDPAMQTEKTGYQNGVNTGYGGFVDPAQKVGYSFELTNKGETPLKNLIFTDTDIGVTFTPEAIQLNGYSKIGEMYAYLYNADGTVKKSYKAGELTEAILKELLAAGIEVGEKIGIYGFKYDITKEKKWSADGKFVNTVYTTATSVGDNGSTSTLHGLATWMVQKRTFTAECFHVYEWMGKGVKVTKEELLKPLQDKNVTTTGGKIELCAPSGSSTATSINPNATLNSDGSITYTGTATGVDTVYYKVKGIEYDSQVFHYHIYTYNVTDNTYVLDYGLSVELNGVNFGLLNNDTLYLSQNTYGTSYQITGVTIPTTNKYGAFAWDTSVTEGVMGGSLKYTPTAIMNGPDTVTVNIRLLETGATEVTKFTGLDMSEVVTTVPANVVYYEEDFPGLVYVSEGDNQWVQYETTDGNGNSIKGTEQSANQDTNYGSDPNYSEDKILEWTEDSNADEESFVTPSGDLNDLQQGILDKLNGELANGGYVATPSNGTIKSLIVKNTADVMWFEFAGTGFEIVSRTDDDDYAVVMVIVQRKNDDGTYTNVHMQPVITESKGGDLYQVPIISVTGLDHGKYKVVLRASSIAAAGAERVLYIDGVRIYEPMGTATDYYKPEEQEATFSEVKNNIGNGYMVYLDIGFENEESESKVLLTTGTTLVENQSPFEDEDSMFQPLVLQQIEDVYQYLQIGPNNELYMDGNSNTNTIIFYLKETTGAKSIQIGAHRKTQSFSGASGAVPMYYGSSVEAILTAEKAWMANNQLPNNAFLVSSGTEQYFELNCDLLTKNENGYYMVMVAAGEGMNGQEVLALTNLKLSGFELVSAEEELKKSSAEGTLNEEAMVQAMQTFANARKPVVEDVPTNAELNVKQVALQAAKVSSGKLATLAVKADAAAQTVVVTDQNGNVVEATRMVRKASGDVATFSFIWRVNGTRGEKQNYVVRVYDADGLASVNVMTVTVTIK